MFKQALRGGVHPSGFKELSNQEAIKRFPLPDTLYLSLQQHLGAPATPLVKVGDRVRKGQLVAASQGMISAPVHAPTSGRVTALAEHTAPHPSGLPVLVISLEPDGLDEWDDIEPVSDPFARDPQEICTRVGAAGIVGLGGATFPAAVKLGSSLETGVETLILNGGECEPYLTCDDRLMREKADEIIRGACLMQHAVQAKEVIIGIEDNKPEALEKMQAAAAGSGIQVKSVPSRYPMGSEKQLVQQLTGIELPARSRAAASGLVMHNVATARAVAQTIDQGRPLISRIVTLSGQALTHQGNWEVPLGTLASQLINYASGFDCKPARLIMGGPMMGIQLPNLHVPIIKGSSGILALTEEEINPTQPSPCVRCARCVQACPMGLLPLEMAANIRKGDVEAAQELGLSDCVGCGACSYTCPASLPLVHLFNYAKGELANREKEARKMKKTQVLAQRREERVARQAREREELLAARRAAAAKKAAEEAAEDNPS
ncbi:electron transport complex subunit RsxC [Marinospirillum perlucidum]|uniref:electron transport complex subunit RsxC n=1 Tax=Marinospirillum perlucidum TaxID=1982602 RepID=UPI000DF3595D|nr:electron transport complex subunit RsxC [Marinospirillum perlucidum]